jgi:hypothetical protein
MGHPVIDRRSGVPVAANVPLPANVHAWRRIALTSSGAARRAGSILSSRRAVAGIRCASR